MINLPPSMQSTLPTHLYAWLILIAGLICLAYVARVISKEKISLEEDGQILTWNKLKLFIPNWWISQIEDDRCHFYQGDQQYQWSFIICKTLYPNIELSKERFLDQEKIILDEDAVLSSRADYCLKNPNIFAHIKDFLHLEGTATQDESERIYLEATWIKLNSGETYQFISQSAVLAGMVEGPYVEEVLKRLDLLTDLEFLKNSH